MKLDKVHQNNEPDYPSFDDYRQNRRKFLMMLAAGIGVASVSGGCKTGGTPVPPAPPRNPPPPVEKGTPPPAQPEQPPRERGQIPAPEPARIDPPPLQRQQIWTDGLIAAPEPPIIKGKVRQPEPPQSP